MSPKPSRPPLADQIAARRDELRLLALPDINAGPLAVPGVQELALEAIEPNPDQPRREFSALPLAELADSIRAHGIITPILVSPLPGSGDVRYRLVAGERRWRAAHMAERATIPALIRPVSKAEAIELALIENLHRQDLSPIEEALAYRRLLRDHAYSQQQLGSTIGRSQTYISKRLALLVLDTSVVAMLESGQLSASAARELTRLKDQDLQRRTAAAIAEGRLNARQIERAVSAAQRAESLANGAVLVDLGPIENTAARLLNALENLPPDLDETSRQRLRTFLAPVATAVLAYLD